MDASSAPRGLAVAEVAVFNALSGGRPVAPFSALTSMVMVSPTTGGDGGGGVPPSPPTALELAVRRSAASAAAACSGLRRTTAATRAAAALTRAPTAHVDIATDIDAGTDIDVAITDATHRTRSAAMMVEWCTKWQYRQHGNRKRTAS